MISWLSIRTLSTEVLRLDFGVLPWSKLIELRNTKNKHLNHTGNDTNTHVTTNRQNTNLNLCIPRLAPGFDLGSVIGAGKLCNGHPQWVRCLACALCFRVTSKLVIQEYMSGGGTTRDGKARTVWCSYVYPNVFYDSDQRDIMRLTNKRRRVEGGRKMAHAADLCVDERYS